MNEKVTVLVSACLFGVPCRYDGKSVAFDELEKMQARANLVPFCAEIYGGLPTPRPASEIDGARVVTEAGVDVTEAFRKGASEGVRLIKMLDCRYALLKDKSPSCGVGQVYSGKFDRTLVPGNGILAQALMDAGVKVFSSKNIDELLKALDAEA